MSKHLFYLLIITDRLLIEILRYYQLLEYMTAKSIIKFYFIFKSYIVNAIKTDAFFQVLAY